MVTWRSRGKERMTHNKGEEETESEEVDVPTSTPPST
jgi:hypothetical protein